MNDLAILVGFNIVFTLASFYFLYSKLTEKEREKEKEEKRKKRKLKKYLKLKAELQIDK